MSELTYNEDRHSVDDEGVYNIATPVDLIQANFHNSTRQANINQRRPPSQNNTQLPPDAWSQLCKCIARALQGTLTPRRGVPRGGGVQGPYRGRN